MNTASAESKTATELLIFTIGDDEYCIDILKVQEIRGYDAVTRIANTPEFIKGVINLRGNIVPIIDLRLKLRNGEVLYTDTTVVIILNVLKRVIGVVVDTVSDVITLTPDAIKPAPEFGSALDTQYILGLISMGDRLLVHVDIERLIGSRDMGLIADAVGE